eukprot:TRINITY_DN4121_c0_g4_i2.p1 TRINITY_DN4121_c0_g4~~TRINITY_DN4121_c0_g4_i2.p1  ORF type:complete len:476 (-),score=98.67 TRINITY_DN4121_c0_g4_i2:119-1546(-)
MQSEAVSQTVLEPAPAAQELVQVPEAEEQSQMVIAQPSVQVLTQPHVLPQHVVVEHILAPEEHVVADADDPLAEEQPPVELQAEGKGTHMLLASLPQFLSEQAQVAAQPSGQLQQPSQKHHELFQAAPQVIVTEIPEAHVREAQFTSPQASVPIVIARVPASDQRHSSAQSSPAGSQQLQTQDEQLSAQLLGAILASAAPIAAHVGGEDRGDETAPEPKSASADEAPTPHHKAVGEAKHEEAKSEEPHAAKEAVVEENVHPETKSEQGEEESPEEDADAEKSEDRASARDSEDDQSRASAGSLLARRSRIISMAAAKKSPSFSMASLARAAFGLGRAPQVKQVSPSAAGALNGLPRATSRPIVVMAPVMRMPVANASTSLLQAAQATTDLETLPMCEGSTVHEGSTFVSSCLANAHDGRPAAWGNDGLHAKMFLRHSDGALHLPYFQCVNGTAERRCRCPILSSSGTCSEQALQT